MKERGFDSDIDALLPLTAVNMDDEQKIMRSTKLSRKLKLAV